MEDGEWVWADLAYPVSMYFILHKTFHKIVLELRSMYGLLRHTRSLRETSPKMTPSILRFQNYIFSLNMPSGFSRDISTRSRISMSRLLARQVIYLPHTGLQLALVFIHLRCSAKSESERLTLVFLPLKIPSLQRVCPHHPIQTLLQPYLHKSTTLQHIFKQEKLIARHSRTVSSEHRHVVHNVLHNYEQHSLEFLLILMIEWYTQQGVCIGMLSNQLLAS